MKPIHVHQKSVYIYQQLGALGCGISKVNLDNKSYVEANKVFLIEEDIHWRRRKCDVNDCLAHCISVRLSCSPPGCYLYYEVMMEEGSFVL